MAAILPLKKLKIKNASFKNKMGDVNFY